MKKRLGVWLLLVMAFVAGTAAIASASSQTSDSTENNFKLYDSKVDKFQIQYPATWKVMSIANGPNVTFVSPRENEKDKFSESVNIFVKDLETNNASLENIEESSLIEKSRYLSKFELVERKNYEISNVPAKIIVYKARQGALKMKYMQALLIADNKLYCILFTGEEDCFDKFESIVKRIMFSFKAI